MNTFGGILKEAIRSKKLTLSSVARATGTHKGYISGICNGKLNPPSPKMLQKFCKVLEMDYNDMLTRSAFEKLPKGVVYVRLQDLLSEALGSGQTKAPDNTRSWA